MKKRRPRGVWGWVAALALAAALFFAWMQGGEPWDASDAPDFPRASATVARADGVHVPFDVELATTDAQQIYGLMFRRALPANAGMLFIWEREQPISMWMKNTFIPLDLLFLDRRGTVVRIAANARPLDLTPLASGVPALGVLEINGGEAARQGIKTGDKVLFPAFSGGS